MIAIWLQFLFSLLMIFPSFASQKEAHQEAQSIGQKSNDEIKKLAQSMDLSNIPGYKTDSPPETQLNHLSMDDEALSVSQKDEVGKHMTAQAQERLRFTFHPEKDPLFVAANKAIKDPHQTLKEEITEIESSEEPHIEEVTCEESGEEYTQSCTKRLIVELKVVPQKGYTNPRWCYGHRNGIGPGKDYCNPGCVAGNYVITQEKSVTVIREEWEDGCKRLETQTEEGLCRYMTKTTSQASNAISETRIIQGEPITRPHFEETYQYACLKKSPQSCQAYQNRGCYQVASHCKEKMANQCVLWEQTYRCSSNKPRLKRFQTSGKESPFCLTGDCTDSSYEPNNEMFKVMSHLSVLREAQNDLQNHKIIFKGEDRRCTRNCLSFRDCCGNGRGWGVSLRLSSCDKEEQELAEIRKKNRCVQVGTYCAEKDNITGICIRKKTTFCCYGTKLARLIQENARSQLKIGFGTPEAPQCVGLSAEEMSRVNFDRIDFSELFQDIRSQMVPKSQTESLSSISPERIQENMKLVQEAQSEKVNQNKMQKLSELTTKRLQENIEMMTK